MPLDHRAGPQPEELIRRLRAWSLSSWSPQRLAAARRTVQRLADLSLAGLRREVPEVGAYAIADQLVVLRRDAHDAGAGDAAEQELRQLAADLGW